MSKVKQIIRLRQNGVALQAIAKGVGLSRNTVKKYLRLIEAKGFDPEDLLTKEDQQVDLLLADPDPHSGERYQALLTLFPHFEKELKRTGVNRWVVWGEYKQRHPDGYSYPHFCRHLRTWQGCQSATMHFEHSPAEKLYIDFAGQKLPWVDPTTGEIHYAQVYIALLGFSQLTYVRAVSSQKKEDFFFATENAFHFFGGVTRVLIPDNLKSAVSKASKYEADINTDFADWKIRMKLNTPFRRK